ncbi:ABC transporter substrate-binding protein [Polaromonas sp.]|uniref:ABC transporter substrate-binding protein n=1 Tax=Polaromonas sp. TaxID=1869339 RepID=UPI00183E6CFB|nr:ABC transporter substrate-binding protein [Polaromonas sp.]NMM06932.1 ABC transporter substrate-binding protein [Polaromonas sp.]
MYRKIATFWAAITLAAVSIHVNAADPIRIGLVSEITGPNAEAGANTVNGAKLALEEVNKGGGVLGRLLELKIEDNQSTNPGSVLAVSKLGSEGNITALIAPVRSTQVQASAPTIAKLGLPTMIGGSDYGLTHTGNAWLFRARPNDSYSAKVIVDYGVNTLKKKKWAIIHSTDTFGTGGKNMVLEELKLLGVTPVLVQGYTNNTQDFTPIVLAIKQSGADILTSYTPFSTDAAIFATQLRQLGVNTPWIGSATLVSDSTLKLAKDALHDTYSVSDFFAEANPEAQAYAQKYKQQFGREADFYSSWAYDAVHILALAMNRAKSTKPDDIRKEISAIRGFKGAEGTYNFDKNGDGLHGYNIVKNEKGKIVFIKHTAFTPKE